MRLKTRVVLVYRQWGCAHYGQEYRFAGLEDRTPASSRRHYFEVTARLLDMKLRRGDEALDARFASRLRELAPEADARLNQEERPNVVPIHGRDEGDSSVTGFSCGDARCSLEVDRTDEGHVTLTAIYDFPL